MAQEELEYNVGEGEEETSVDMNDDGSDAKLSAVEETIVVEEESTQGPDSKSEDSKSEDLHEYSSKVKKRIDKMTARMRESQRREDAALDYAKKVHQENQTLQEKNKQTSNERLGEAQTRVESQVAALKQVIRKAREEMDIDTETEAQQRLTTIVYEQQRLGEQVEYQRQVAQQPVIQEQPEILQPRQREPDIKAEEWAEKNQWFGNNTVMTHTVYGIHNELVKNEGFDPASDEYYHEVDRRMRQMFPQEFDGTNQPAQSNNRSSRPVQTVAPATRSSGVNNARRTVKLTPSQVAIAKKLGVPLEEYAKHVKD